MSKKFKRIKFPTGRTGWQAKLRDVYANFEEFESYDNAYNIAARLKYKSAKSAWKTNPVIRGSVRPGDLSRAPRAKKTKPCPRPLR